MKQKVLYVIIFLSFIIQIFLIVFENNFIIFDFNNIDVYQTAVVVKIFYS